MTPHVGEPPCLEVRDIWKIFGSRPEEAMTLAAAGTSRADVLDQTGCTIGVKDASLSVERGETFVVMGLSGSGKSTLVRCIAQLTKPSAGTVWLDGQELTAMPEAELREVRRQKLSMVFQHFGLFPHRTVIDNAAYGLEVQKVPKAERLERAAQVLTEVGLAGYERHYPGQLSGGMQQRVGLARALTVEPEILFFDEPFSALDPLIRRDMQDQLLELQETMQRTLVFITHDFAEAIKLGDRIAIMKDGVFDQIGTASELITSPATDYVAEFTEDVPKIKVLRAGDVMRPVSTGANPARQAVRVSDTVEAILPQLLLNAEPLDVTDAAGSIVGTVNRDAIAQLLQLAT